MAKGTIRDKGFFFFFLPFARITLLLIQRVAYIHTRELCSTISWSAAGHRAAAPEQVAAKCFSQEHSKGALFFSFREIITLPTTSI